MRLHLSVRFTGRVQGVGFRYTVQKLAGASGLDGFVRNDSDGSVQMEAEGTRVELEQLLVAIRTSRAGRNIEHEYIFWSEQCKKFLGFEIRFR